MSERIGRPCRLGNPLSEIHAAEFARGHCHREVALLLSMTGFGEARLQDQRWTIAVELRTVNNRHFKLSAKLSESYAMLEPALEQLVREKVRRGTVQLTLRIDRPRRPEDYRINLVALSSYRDQLKGLRGFDESMLSISGRSWCLPGVVEDFRSSDQRPTKTGPRSPRSSTRRSRSFRPRAPRRARRWPPS